MKAMRRLLCEVSAPRSGTDSGTGDDEERSGSLQITTNFSKMVGNVPRLDKIAKANFSLAS